MVTGDFGYHENATALRTLLEFESQRHGLPIEFNLADLRQPPRPMFRKAVQVFCHNVGGKLDITFPFPDGEARARAQAYYIKGMMSLSEDAPKEVIGLRGEDYLHPIAHIEGAKLFIYFNILDLPMGAADGEDVSPNILAKVCDFIFSRAMPVLKETIESYDYREERARYAEVKCVALKAKEKELEQNIASNERELRECTEGIVRYTRALQADRLLLEDLKARTDRKKAENAGAEYMSLLRMVPQPYKEISFDEQELKAYTHLIVIRHEGIDYEIGEFEMRIAFETGRLTITNLTNPHDGYDHPHINDGTVCLGNISTGVAKMIAESEYVGALTVLHSFLCSVNSGDQYHDIRNWGEGWTDYESCYENNSVSECLDCSDYDCPYYDDRYSRCWEGASTNDCIECSCDCHYRQDAMDNCHSDHSARECRSCHQICDYQGDDDACYEDSDDGMQCIGCDVTGCGYRREEPEKARVTTPKE